MLSNLRRVFKPLVIEDPVFGSLRFMRMPDPRKSYWEVAARFRGLSEAPIELFIDADETGPKDQQRILYARMADKFEVILGLTLVELERAYSQWFQRQPPAELSARFSLESLSVPSMEADTMEWELCFSCSDDSEHLFTVEFVGWKPTGNVSIDG
jgi:hypothetical protein